MMKLFLKKEMECSNWEELIKGDFQATFALKILIERGSNAFDEKQIRTLFNEIKDEISIIFDLQTLKCFNGLQCYFRDTNNKARFGKRSYKTI